ncbi:uncharacterized protein L201_000570 [Kwoniella dendrophila CBS 6074]|uniref:Magnesium transporter n=1 Tax=Kwoniella dendrophila CBS 6074 TaxID=1295534 RepID=A0AAX4JLQ4_9TREE
MAMSSGTNPIPEGNSWVLEDDKERFYALLQGAKGAGNDRKPNVPKLDHKWNIAVHDSNHPDDVKRRPEGDDRLDMLGSGDNLYWSQWSKYRRRLIGSHHAYNIGEYDKTNEWDEDRRWGVMGVFLVNRSAATPRNAVVTVPIEERYRELRFLPDELFHERRNEKPSTTESFAILIMARAIGYASKTIAIAGFVVEDLRRTRLRDIGESHVLKCRYLLLDLQAFESRLASMRKTLVKFRKLNKLKVDDEKRLQISIEVLDEKIVELKGITQSLGDMQEFTIAFMGISGSLDLQILTLINVLVLPATFFASYFAIPFGKVPDGTEQSVHPKKFWVISGTIGAVLVVVCAHALLGRSARRAYRFITSLIEYWSVRKVRKERELFRRANYYTGQNAPPPANQSSVNTNTGSPGMNSNIPVANSRTTSSPAGRGSTNTTMSANSDSWSANNSNRRHGYQSIDVNPPQDILEMTGRNQYHDPYNAVFHPPPSPHRSSWSISSIQSVTTASRNNMVSNSSQEHLVSPQGYPNTSGLAGAPSNSNNQGSTRRQHPQQSYSSQSRSQGNLNQAQHYLR